MRSTPPLISGAYQKFVRAKDHLVALEQIHRQVVYSKYTLAPEKTDDPEEVAFRLRLPRIPNQYVMVTADCIHNLRCVLDHLVWQAADKHEPDRPVSEKKRNMFPICLTPGEFRDQLQRKRLNGLPGPAVQLVESLQPFNQGCELLGALGELENIDKHRSLLVVGSVTRNIFSETFERHGLRLPFASQADPVWDDEVFVKINRRWVPESFQPFGDLEVEAHGIMEISFKDPPAEGMSVRWTLQQLTEFVGDCVLPAFRPFLA